MGFGGASARQSCIFASTAVAALCLENCVHIRTHNFLYACYRCTALNRDVRTVGCQRSLHSRREWDQAQHYTVCTEGFEYALSLRQLLLRAFPCRSCSPADFPVCRKEAGRIYSELRANLLRTLLGGYHSTGYFWEQYDDRSGRGLRSHPFTGWTALVVLIMAEVY